MRIAFAASRKLGEELILWVHQNRELYNIEIIGGIAPEFKGWWDDKVNDLYEELGINVFDDFDDLVFNGKPDLIFSINYWRIIPEDQINRIPKGIINIHHSYLLRFKGRYSTSWAIIHARKDNYWKHGSTLHYVNKNLDSGSIIASESCSITTEDTAETLFRKVEGLAM